MWNLNNPPLLFSSWGIFIYMKLIITERQETILEGLITEGENKPTNPALWAQCLAWARSRYKVCPSAYCNGAAAKHYKSKGGGWRKTKK
jgi:hypothetical protein